MNDADDEISRSRMDHVKRLPPTVSGVIRYCRPGLTRQKLSWRIVRRTFSSWVIYVFGAAYA
jgi:hypothetical protein